MELPLKVGTLLYIFDRDGRVLLMERYQEPNLGLWSPPGGKVHTHLGESPYDCAVREANEEIGIRISIDQLHLSGFLSEEAYENSAHWHIFLFRVNLQLNITPPPHKEGRFQFFTKDEIPRLRIPETDRMILWPKILDREVRFFSAHCRSLPDDEIDFRIDESIRQS